MTNIKNDNNQSPNLSPFQLPRTSIFKWISPIIEPITGLSQLHRKYIKNSEDLSTADFLRFTLNSLDIQYNTTNLNTNNIPASGPLVIVANHPLGGVEGVILAEILLKFRPDLQIMANYFLKRIPELSPLFIAVDVFEGKNAIRANLKAIKQADQHLANDGALLIFPAGEVSTYDKSKQLQDKEWNRLAGKLVKSHKANCLPIFIDGKNSKLFYLAGKIHPLLRTMLLGRELLNKKGKNLNIKGGNLIAPNEIEKLNNAEEVTKYLRLNTYLIDREKTLTPSSIAEQNLEAIQTDVNTNVLVNAVQSLPNSALLHQQKQFSVYISNAEQMGELLTQIGIIRERCFREVGEGTGKKIDVDEFDQDYLHLFIWDNDRNAIVGAYRVGLVDQILNKKGLKGLYSRTLFKFDLNFVDKLKSSIEMGRSVIDLPYQKNLTPLLLLWKGISAYIVRNPQYQVLFGPVSISGDYKSLTHQLIIQCLTTHYYDQESAKLVEAITPVQATKKPFWPPSLLTGLADLQLLSKLVSRLENGKSLPVLIRQYLTLNGRFVCFNLDPDFNQAIDGLIVVDLTKASEPTLSKYMGNTDAKKYLSMHSNNN